MCPPDQFGQVVKFFFQRVDRTHSDVNQDGDDNYIYYCYCFFSVNYELIVQAAGS